LLTADAALFIAEAYGDVNAYLKTKIEADVKLHK
jgi:hypothetical protein